ncbi:JAB domain-containing protein [Sphingomonas sp. RS6]
MPSLDQPLRINDAASAAALFAPLAAGECEAGAIAYLARDCRLLGLRHIGGGAHAWIDVPVRAVVADALSFDAAAVVMAHHHPSGDATPSRADGETTRMLARALEPLGIRLVDHLVLTRAGSTSFQALGLL